MKLISGLCCALLGGVLSLTGRADCLYWMINQAGSDEPIDFQFAQMVDASDKSVFKTTDGYDGVLSDSYAQSGTEGSYMSETVMDIGTDYSLHSFYIQLCRYANGELKVLGESDTLSFSEVSSSISGSSLNPANTLVVSTFTVPEPTSALLMLLGLSGLALKRRNR